MDRDSNIYTFLFTIIMVLVVAIALATAASLLKELQSENVRKEKMQNILSSIGVETNRENSENLYNKFITNALSLKSDGSIDNQIDAFKINLAKEIKKPFENQRFPIYIAKVEENKYYIIPLRGAGLWDVIWGYIALKEDKSTIKGAVFDHKAETAGLGAEITKEWFQNRFVGEKVMDNNGKLVGINISKNNNDPQNLDKLDHEVDAISGATITGDGVTEMIFERLQHYLPFFNNNNNALALN